MKIGVIILARANFGRWPDKVLFPLDGKPMVEWVIEKSEYLNVEEIILSTTSLDEDEPIREYAEGFDIELLCGEPDNRGKRYEQAIKEYGLDYIIPISPACPFFDIHAENELIDYCRNFPGYRCYYYGDALHSMAIPSILKSTAIKAVETEPELFTSWSGEQSLSLYSWNDIKVRNKYLYNVNIAYKLQAVMAERICIHLGHFPNSHEEIVKAYMEIQQ